MRNLKTFDFKFSRVKFVLSNEEAICRPWRVKRIVLNNDVTTRLFIFRDVVIFIAIIKNFHISSVY